MPPHRSPLRSVLDTSAALATSADGLRPGAVEVSMRISRTPRAESLSRNASILLSKDGLLLSPAISTARHSRRRHAAGAAAMDVLRPTGGAASESVCRRRATPATHQATTRNNISCPVGPTRPAARLRTTRNAMSV